MRLITRETMECPCSPEEVRSFIRNIKNWPAFVGKVQSIRGDTQEFKGKLLHRTRQVPFVGKETQSAREDTVAFLIVAEGEQGAMNFRIDYRIIPRRKGCRVMEMVTFDQSIPFFAWLIMKLFAFYGRPQGTTNLQDLRTLLLRSR